MQMVRDKWDEMKKNGVLECTLYLIETEKEAYKDYYVKNHERWSERLLGGNSEVVAVLNTYTDPKTAEGLAADYLRDWLTRRFAYLDSVWGTK